ncbi:hypothetical protein RvY_08872-2 [Ramazzottius varieornatus]|uniref:CCAAT-binding factor domain-containing protein n=1 Tax=Ramazzottius varieornatus TaxID=947166 RepID=A0A1D1V7C4_RAMVA|nr:hypothetical protein RvY_08872-2 [Ramazzottius varieornatus]
MADLKEEARHSFEKVRHDAGDYRRDGNKSRWTKMVIKSGTLADKVAALTLAVKQSPRTGLGSLDTLLAMLRKKSRREQVITLDAISALFKDQLLPADNKLAKFETHSADALKGKSKAEREETLIEWYLEDQLKERYFSFLMALETLLKDPIDFTRLKAMGVTYDLLVSKPEREEKLLQMLVNKLGDPEKKVASKACQFLIRLIQQHPNMKPVVVEEVERLIYRPNVGAKAQYYALCFLVQIKLKDSENILAVKLVKIYFSLFKDPNPKMISAILSGVNRTYPFTKGPQNLMEHIDMLFRYIYTVTAQVGIQILMLLYQVMEREGAITDRFYMALYRKMMDPELLTHPGRSSSLLNLLYKSMKRDESVTRVKAFIKRILQLAMTQLPPFICGALIIISEMLKMKPKAFRAELFQATLANKVGPSHHMEEEEDGTTKPVSRTPITEYSAVARNPLYCGAEFVQIWELHALCRHYHPSVARFADCVLQSKPIQYAGDPFEDFTSIHFLDRFVYRNPKKKATDKTQDSARDLPVLSDQYLNLPKKKIPDDEQFLHRYLTQKLRQKKANALDDDMEVESVADSEFDQFLDEYEKGQADVDMDFAADVNDEQEEREALDDDASLFGDEDDDQDNFSEGEKDALEAAFSSDNDEGETEDDDVDEIDGESDVSDDDMDDD